jgi:Uma2 family endonuclease
MKQYLTLVNDDFSESVVEEPQSEYGFTYEDYLTWKFKERIELIKGKIFKMSPAPAITHQKIAADLFSYFVKKLNHAPCQLFFSPIDVKLIGRPFKKRKIPDNQIHTVVQPDIIVVCDPDKLIDNRSVSGAPEMVIEILSPGNTNTETKYKLNLYEENGVEEYWVVHPPYKYVEVYLLKDNAYSKPTIYEMGDTISCKILKGIDIPVDQIFRQLN